MAEPVLVLRPEPGAARTAHRLRQADFRPIVYPLYEVEALPWTPPDPAEFDALLVSSANTFRHAGPGLARYAAKPLFAVGAATARAAREASFRSVETGGGTMAATIPQVVSAGHVRILHPGGTEVRDYDPQGLSVTRLPVYRTAPRGDTPGLMRGMPRDRAVFALVHSPRAGARLAELVPAESRDWFTIIAISHPASQACGDGWRDRVAVGDPTDAALIAGLQMLV